MTESESITTPDPVELTMAEALRIRDALEPTAPDFLRGQAFEAMCRAMDKADEA